MLLNAQILDGNCRWYQDHSKVKYENDQCLQNQFLEQAKCLLPSLVSRMLRHQDQVIYGKCIKHLEV